MVVVTINVITVELGNIVVTHRLKLFYLQSVNDKYLFYPITLLCYPVCCIVREALASAYVKNFDGDHSFLPYRSANIPITAALNFLGYDDEFLFVDHF